jgi:proline racemase
MASAAEETKTPLTTGNGIEFTLPERLFKDRSVLQCIDCHAAGEPARVVLSGVPELPRTCTSALKKRTYMMEHLDHLRKILLLEPRGYPCQNANFVFRVKGSVENEKEEEIQYVIAEQNKIYPLMSGHNTICVATALLECGVIPMMEPISNFTLHAPAGPIEIEARCENGKAQSISFRNAPAFVEHLNVTVQVPHGIGPVQVDIAYGGMWYAIVDIHQFQENPSLQQLNHLRLEQSCGRELCRVGEMIKVACREQFPVQHPTEDYPGVDILAFRGKPSLDSKAHAKNAVIMSNNVLHWDKPDTWTAMIDRSPCGTGTCAIMAVLHARGELKVGEDFVHESIVGSIFVGTLLQETTVGSDKPAVVPQVSGSAYVTQYSQVVVDSTDPFPEGYRVADIW